MLDKARTIIIKIGSSLLVDAGATLRSGWLGSLAGDIAALQQQGRHVVIVSSGAVALSGWQTGRLTLPEKQAAAAIGQIGLMQAWQTALNPHGFNAAQILLTQDDTEDRRRSLNAKDTINTLLAHKVVPVINENDTIATQEIRFGDNDRLAAKVAVMLSADLLVILSDIDGLYTGNPSLDPDAEHIPLVESLTPDIMAMGEDSSNLVGSGGMITKLAAAQIATQSGTPMIIASGQDDNPIKALADGVPHTLFTANTAPLTARKAWIAGLISTQGKLTIDNGAVSALSSGKSLLPAGITAVHGTFQRGDVVELLDSSGTAHGQGLVNLSSTEIDQIKGCHSRDIAIKLGYVGRETVMHRDNLVWRAYSC